LKTIGEFVAPHLPAYDFAREVVDRFILPPIQGQRRNIVAVYLDPSNFKHIGDGHTIAIQIIEVLEPAGLGLLKASNDRIGGWQLMYQLLQIEGAGNHPRCGLRVATGRCRQRAYVQWAWCNQSFIQIGPRRRGSSALAKPMRKRLAAWTGCTKNGP
jgi:hypothetical protein